MLGLYLLVPTVAFCQPERSGTERPNIILIMTDDQGYGDMSCHGNPILKTPHLDRLHSESVRFTDFHVSPTCSPTRAALMTGMHEFRSGVTHTIMERERLRLAQVTLAELLLAAHYSTGIFGKWHLGDEPEYQPDRRGFQEVFIHGGGGIGQTFPGSCGDFPGNSYYGPNMLHNRKVVSTNGYCTDEIFHAALRWMEHARRKPTKEPFFAYIATNAPHAPYLCPLGYGNEFQGKVPDDVAHFFGMIQNIDDNVGRLLSKLKDWGIERQTLVIFMNDNGGTAGVPVFNAGMRGKKGTPFLGGTRAACFWRWPGTFKPGNRTQLAAHIDILPTLVSRFGIKEGIPKNVEGRNLWPVLLNENAPWDDRILFTHVGRWPKGEAKSSKYRQCSVRNTQYHMVCSNKENKKQWMLFDVKADPGEKNDIARQKAEVIKSLEQQYDAWWDSIQADLVNEDAVGPAKNPFAQLHEEATRKHALLNGNALNSSVRSTPSDRR
jgi:arylsulfatase